MITRATATRPERREMSRAGFDLLRWIIVRATLRVLTVLALGVVACGLDAMGTLDPLATNGSDAGSDAPTTAEGGTPDASADAPSDAATDAAPSTFCAAHGGPNVIHCWDFEGAATSIGTFDSQLTDGTIAVVTAGGSQAMSVKLGVGTSARAAWVRKAIGVFGAGATTYEIRFRFAISATTLDYAALGGFRDSNGSTFGVASYGYGASLDLSVTSTKATAVTTTAGASWHTAIVELRQAAVRPKAKVTIDGTVVSDGVWDVGDTPILDLRLGAYYTSGNSGGYEALFDDVLILRQ